MMWHPLIEATFCINPRISRALLPLPIMVALGIMARGVMVALGIMARQIFRIWRSGADRTNVYRRLSALTPLPFISQLIL
jgi:hypothetical protein